MPGNVMNKKQVIEETIKVLCGIELPMYQRAAITAIQGSIKNLEIALRLINAEESAGKDGIDNGAD